MDWVELIVKVAAALGFNPVQVRWKLMRIRDGLARAGRDVDQTVAHIGYRHKTCRDCGHVMDRGERVCPRCGAPAVPRFVQVLERVGLAVPAIVSVSTLLIAANVAVYVKVALSSGTQGFLGFTADTLYRHGAHFPPAVRAGEWWRLGTAIFLHVGLWHILFNMMALNQIGPAIEQIYGRARMLFFYMLTGVVANLGSEIFGLHAVSAGASGAIMGLCGIAAGWGQRDGTSVGREIRNRMIKWGVYTLAFGFFIGADNGAHFWGFASGAAIGWFVRPAWRRQPSIGAFGLVAGLAGIAAATAAAALAFFPPAKMMDFRAAHTREFRSPADAYFRHWRQVCALHEQGKTRQAAEEFKKMIAPSRGPVSVGPQVITGLCAELKTLQDLCDRNDLKGYQARVHREDGEDGENGDNLDDDAAEVQFRFTCDRISPTAK